jgi:hypothetical protein
MTSPYRSSLPAGRDGFDRLLLAEWTKLRSVPRWVLTMIAAVLLMVLFAVVGSVSVRSTEAAPDSGGGGGDVPVQPPVYQDTGHSVYRPLSGDGSLVARVVNQARGDGNAKAGLLIRTSDRRGAPYAAVLVTPDHGVRLQSGFGATDIAGSASGAPRWLRLDREGTRVTGYESADGRGWSRIGAVELDGLAGTARLGLFVASPDKVRIERQFGNESISTGVTVGEATFDGVRDDPAQDGPWRDDDRSVVSERSVFTDVDGTITLAGSGDIGPLPQFGDDLTSSMLEGVLVALMAIVALAVLFITAEYKRGMILATFTASPRRTRVLAAKALVLAAATFTAGLVGSFGAFLVATPLLRSNGLSPPSLADAGVLRAVVGSAALLAVIAVFSLGVAVLLRRSAAAITVVLLLLLAPQVVATGLPLEVGMWVERLTPSAGFEIQQTVERYDTAIGPWAGFGVLCAYAAVALVLAGRRLRRLRRQDA